MSRISVSRILRDKPGHSDATVRKVKAIAAKYNYVPNPFADALRQKKTGIIGFLMYTDYMSEKTLPGINYFDYLRGMQSVVQENGYQLLIDTITPRQIAERQLPSMLTKGYVEGIIYNGLVNIDYLTFFVEKCPNTVVLGRADDLKLQQVETDNYYGGELVAEYLWKLGHRHFAIMFRCRKKCRAGPTPDGI